MHQIRVGAPVFGIGLALAAAMHASAAQFTNETATRFPADPLEYSNAVTVGDLDGDGDLDIVFANGGGFSSATTPQVLRIYINNGAGVFTDNTAAATGLATFRARGVELGDVDRDGDLDILVAQDFSGQPSLLINNGAGIFTNETASRMPVMLISANRGEFGDMDNDGDLDIYLVNGGTSRFGTGQGKILINDGTGHFTDETATRHPSGTVSQPMDVIFGDIDGDLDLDLRICSRNSQSKLYRNNGAGVYTNIAGVPSDASCYSYDFGDIDGDGDLDMLGVNGSTSVGAAEILLRNGGSGNYTLSNTFPLAGIDDNDSKFFDYDNDGDYDVIIGSLSNTERAYSNDGTGTYTLVNGVFDAVSDSTLDIKVADFNGDGRYDVVTAQGESGNFTNKIYINSGPVDTRPPTIARLEQLADTNDNAGPYAVRAFIRDAYTSDRGFDAKNVTLHYSVNKGSEQTVAMAWDGNELWRGLIPGAASGGTVQYYVTAMDYANNVGTSGTQSFDVAAPPCPADTNHDGNVNIDDLTAVILSWGPLTPTTHHVMVQDFEFSPNVTNALPGDTVEWDWVEGAHTVTSGTSCTPDNVYFNQVLASGTFSYVIPFTFEGSIPYFCVPHCLSNGMSGTIVVADVPGDINEDGTVNIDDLTAVILNWGGCHP
ncbi:MAG TPA: FG-GAP-like repeat-containing protein [Phycisphaerales bacterium]|nr:FG-GAP-like repeat-containing protein [Phycisphaerales bacterium]